MTSTTWLPRLPACQLCYHRKVKCDNGRPKCSSCTRTNSECLVLNTEGGSPISRGSIHDLELKQRTLIASLAPALDDHDRDSSAFRHITESPRATEHAGGSTDPPSTIEASGLSFLRPLFTNSEFSSSNLFQNPLSIANVPEAKARPNALPRPEEARFLFDKYLNGSHVQNPFLLRQDVQHLYDRIFSTIVPNAPTYTSHDLFRAFMILAIGSVTAHRNGEHTFHPVGYYLSAMQHFDKDYLVGGLEGIQDILLIGRFGIYYHIETSTWDIAQLCVRMCIEHGFHQISRARKSLLQQQIERRVFWECYMIDRYSSATLDRSFAIADRDITTFLPANASDEEIAGAAESFQDLDSYCASLTAVQPTEMSVFLFCVRLRQITSRIQAMLSPSFGADPMTSSAPPDFLLTGKLYTNLNLLLEELEEWRKSAPSFESPKCVYEMQDYHDLLHIRERILVIRKAIDVVPKRNGSPPQDLLELCLEDATKWINLFARLYEERKITYTRSYFQMLFASGLSVMFYLSVTSDMSASTLHDSSEVLGRCEVTLRTMGTKLPDAKPYVTAFEVLLRNLLSKRDQYLSRQNADTGLAAPPPPINESFLGNGSDEVTGAHNRQVSNLDAEVMPTASFNQDYPGAEGRDIQHLFNPWGSSQIGHNDNANPESYEDLPLGNDFLHLYFLNGDTPWNMEAGLGEYAYGDPNVYFQNFSGMNFNI